MSSRSVLFINRVYPPAPGATGDLLAVLAEDLAARGWRVTVIAGRPAGVTVRAEERRGVCLEWVGGLPFTRASHWRRALGYLSLYPAMLWRAWRLPRHDVAVFLTDPPLQFLLGGWVRLLKGSRLVHWAQDIYPELAEELGVLRRSGWLARCLRRLAARALRRFDAVVVIGACMRERMLARGLAPARVLTIPNWADTAVVKPLSREHNRRRAEWGVADRFVVMYAGNFGLAHDFTAVLDAAAVLQRERPDVVFVLVGEGPRLKDVQGRAAAEGLNNIRFLPPQPGERLAETLAAGDVHLVSMQDALCGLVVPSKIYGVLAAGRPAIFLGPAESEAAQLLNAEKCGTVLPRADGRELAAAIAHWADNDAARTAAGQRARRTAESGDRAAAVARFDRVLEAVAGGFTLSSGTVSG
jgi:glycosyltransferase involved in cell wall biosynthesis